MTLASKIRIALLMAAALLTGWQMQQQHLRQSRELTAVQAQVQSKTEELEARAAALAAVEQRSNELVEAERRAGNQTLLSLMRERAATTMSASQAASRTHNLGSALANVLDSPEQRDIDREHMRNDIRANLGLFFKLVNLSPDKIEQFIDLHIEMERRKADRMSALLRGTIALADALRERDRDELESQKRMRDVLGPEGYAFRESIGEGMCTDEAKRLLNGIQQNMGGNTLNQEQGDRLQSLIKTELVTIPLDDTDLFRPPEEWAQIVAGRQQNVLRAAAAFLTPAQLDTLRTLAALDLAQRQEQMILKRKSLGIK